MWRLILVVVDIVGVSDMIRKCLKSRGIMGALSSTCFYALFLAERMDGAPG